MKLRLPDSVASPQDLNTISIEVRQYQKWLAHESIKKQVNAKHVSEQPVMSSSIKELFRNYDLSKIIDQHSIESLIETLEKYKDSAPSITLTLAATPTNTVKSTLVGWCRDNISPDILVAFQFNATLLGGIVVRHGSHIFDWSFRRQILAARDRFPEVLRNV